MTKFSSSVVTTSSTPSRVRSSVGTAMPAAPPSAPASITSGTSTSGGASMAPVPIATAASAPR